MSHVTISELMESSGVKFGTSGARGLVEHLSARVAYAYTAGFLAHLEQSGQIGAGSGLRSVAVAGDLRTSTPVILAGVCRAAQDRGFSVYHAGRVPSPAVFHYAASRGIPSIMVTGSHIPEDRNGIKFNTARGEITKADEQGIRAQRVEVPDLFDARGQFKDAACGQLPPVDSGAARAYVERFTKAFPAGALRGLKLAVYGHSAVGRELLVEILEALGARVSRLGWSDVFISVDTEAIRPQDVELASAWARSEGFFALLSTDGDSDRPLLADENGRFLRGDVLGVLTARQLRASFVAAPVSCNSMLEQVGWFKTARTRIGSPYVIEAMEAAVRSGERAAVGFEANGGFLTASALQVPPLAGEPGGEISALPTRDAVISPLAALCAAVAQNATLSALVAALPKRFTASDRLPEFPTELAQARLKAFREALPASAREFLPELGPLASKNEVDGLRLSFENGEVVHLRASGNAPELRCYVEAASEARAELLLREALAKLEIWRSA
ncbi:MAG TPA: phosphomannomutase [Polyangiaceae bacterium]|nr:phosphomannomutase [Polyangiaceae bacterium]